VLLPWCVRFGCIGRPKHLVGVEDDKSADRSFYLSICAWRFGRRCLVRDCGRLICRGVAGWHNVEGFLEKKLLQYCLAALPLKLLSGTVRYSRNGRLLPCLGTSAAMSMVVNRSSHGCYVAFKREVAARNATLNGFKSSLKLEQGVLLSALRSFAQPLFILTL